MMGKGQAYQPQRASCSCSSCRRDRGWLVQLVVAAWRIGNAAAGCRPAAPGWGESGEGAVSLRDTWPPAGSPATAPGGFGGGLGGRDRDGGGGRSRPGFHAGLVQSSARLAGAQLACSPAPLLHGVVVVEDAWRGRDVACAWWQRVDWVACWRVVTAIRGRGYLFDWLVNQSAVFSRIPRMCLVREKFAKKLL